MRILYVGDVVGRSGRAALLGQARTLRERLGLDALVVNGENAAGGYGITPVIAREFFDAGVDIITTGNHVWDQRELIGYIASEPRLIRPLNLAPGTPGRGMAEMRTVRSPIVEVHEFNFFVLLALIAIHVAAAIWAEFREGGAIITAMFTGRKIHEGEPVDAELASGGKLDSSG